MNWIGMKAEDDAFGKQVLNCLDADTLVEWGRDKQVMFGTPQIKKSIFDLVEDTDSPMCLSLLGMVYVQEDMKRFTEFTEQLRKLRSPTKSTLRSSSVLRNLVDDF